MEATQELLSPSESKLLQITSDLACQQQSLVNLYFYGLPQSGEWVLIDAGLPYSADSLRREAQARFGTDVPRAIVLTHGHFDHVGDLPDLADEWDVPVYAHPLEFPYLTGQSSYPPPDPAVGGGAMSFLSRFFPRGPIDLSHRIEALPSDGSIPDMPGWRWIHTPGHTPGHVSLFRDSDALLIAGDAFVTTRQESALAVLTQAQEVCRPPAYYTIDWEQARRSVQMLANLQPEIAVTGHGLPMSGETLRQQLTHLVQNWDQVAVPSYGRYVDRPALADERGVQWVPPPVVDPNLALLIGVGLGYGLGRLLQQRDADSSPSCSES